MNGNGDAAIGFFVFITFIAILFAINQAKIDKMRADSAKRIADGWADHERRMGEFKAANPTASCSNCLYHERYGECDLKIQPRRYFCMNWIASSEHDQAIRLASMTDSEVVAEMNDAGNGDLADTIKRGEAYLPEMRDRHLREQAHRALRLARQELERMSSDSLKVKSGA